MMTPLIRVPQQNLKVLQSDVEVGAQNQTAATKAVPTMEMLAQL
jgi:hypothetical protein